MLMSELSVLVRYSRIYSERRLAEHKVGFPEQVILMYLSSRNQVNQDAIAQFYMIDKGAIAKTISKMEDKKLLTRQQNPENRRENLISLTSKGWEILKVMQVALKEWDDYMSEGLSRKEIEEYERITKKMVSNVSKLKNWSECNE
ncbi:MAG: MarR family transcriptional regulator [Bacillota bacterium]|nr:MarR family transcriptional regulator [Bacillota bacterium]